MYMALDEENYLRHEEKMKKYGIKHESELFLSSKGNFYPLLKEEVEKSWDRMFQRNRDHTKEVEGTIWQIKKENIIGIKE